jgi:hypothetical protein
MTEVYVSNQGDLLQTEILAAELEMLLHTQPHLRALCTYKGDTRGQSTDVIKVRQVDDDDIAESVAEAASVSGTTTISTDTFSLTPSRRVIKREISDFLSGVSGLSLHNPVGLAAFNFGAIMRAFDAIVTALFPSFTGSVGTTAVALTWTDILSGKQTLRERENSGPLFAVLHTEQWTDIETDIVGLAGPQQYIESIQGLAIDVKGPNFVGQTGTGAARLEFHTSNQVTASGGDHRGAIFAPGALAYAEGSPNPVSMNNRIMAPGGVIYSVFDIDGDKANQILWTNYFVAAAIAQAAKGITVLSVDD